MIFACGSIDTPKLIVTTLPHGELMAVESVSLVAHPVRNTPEGLWLAIAPTSSNSVVVDAVVEKGVDVIPGETGVDTICQYLK